MSMPADERATIEKLFQEQIASEATEATTQEQTQPQTQEAEQPTLQTAEPAAESTSAEESQLQQPAQQETPWETRIRGLQSQGDKRHNELTGQLTAMQQRFDQLMGYLAATTAAQHNPVTPQEQPDLQEVIASPELSQQYFGQMTAKQLNALGLDAPTVAKIKTGLALEEYRGKYGKQNTEALDSMVAPVLKGFLKKGMPFDGTTLDLAWETVQEQLQAAAAMGKTKQTSASGEVVSTGKPAPIAQTSPNRIVTPDARAELQKQAVTQQRNEGVSLGGKSLRNIKEIKEGVEAAMEQLGITENSHIW